MSRKVEKIASNPTAELAVKNAKYAKLCKELYLAKKGIEELRGFEKFSNLESLWLNNNEIRKISGLDQNFRIKHLYIQNNKLTTLQGSLKKFKFLQSLHASNNMLKNLDNCLAILSRLPHLKTLDLFDNPIAQEENYRLRVIFMMPTCLEVLDCRKVKDEERAMAKALFSTKSLNGRLTQLGARTRQKSPAELAGELSGATLLLLEDIEEIYARREEKEAELEEKRREEERVALNMTEYTDFSGLPKPSFWPQNGTSQEEEKNSVRSNNNDSTRKESNEEKEEDRKDVIPTPVRPIEHRFDRFSFFSISKSPSHGSIQVLCKVQPEAREKYNLKGKRLGPFQDKLESRMNETLTGTRVSTTF